MLILKYFLICKSSNKGWWKCTVCMSDLLLNKTKRMVYFVLKSCLLIHNSLIVNFMIHSGDGGMTSFEECTSGIQRVARQRDLATRDGAVCTIIRKKKVYVLFLPSTIITCCVEESKKKNEGGSSTGGRRKNCSVLTFIRAKRVAPFSRVHWVMIASDLIFSVMRDRFTFLWNCAQKVTDWV